ncbi:Thaumatin-like protein 1 [Sesamum angolense]|uniref:Thaumatin-like protein 1 n=1 Tax=Sesamum angolense TaxID=2727404 RepID=A0AAE1XDM5_9LAMI|nr:Thaumatin-like protein 1 [Sesamum angolense]
MDSSYAAVLIILLHIFQSKGADRLVWALLGQDGLHLRWIRPRILCYRRLRLRPNGVQRCRRHCRHLAEFTLGTGSMDFYDVSLVDGYNLPLMVDVRGGSGQCASTGCLEDLNQRCPAELRTEGGGACRSACDAFNTPEYCCKGEYGSPSTCKPSMYSQLFKNACPKSYSYAYDDATSTFTAPPLITSSPSARPFLAQNHPNQMMLRQMALYLDLGLHPNPSPNPGQGRSRRPFWQMGHGWQIWQLETQVEHILSRQWH